MSADASDTFPGWPRVEAYLLACIKDGDDAKLDTVDLLALVGQRALEQEQLAEARRVLRRLQVGDGCWAFDQGYAACEFRGLERALKPSAGRRRLWPWSRR